ncbi:MAG: hypothetical protein ACI87W_000192 [Halieaceae bacterium]|jgi:hypothetical protein
MIYQPVRFLIQHRRNTATSVMPHHQDMCDLEYVYRVLQHRQAVQVAVCDHVGSIAMNKNLAWLQPNDLVRRYAAAGAADPQITRLLLGGKFGKNRGHSR